MNYQKIKNNLIKSLLLITIITCLNGCKKNENTVAKKEEIGVVESIEQETNSNIMNETEEDTQKNAVMDDEKEEVNHGTVVTDYEILKFVETPIEKELIDWDNVEDELVHITLMIRLNKEWKKEKEVKSIDIGYRDPDSKHDVISKTYKGDVKIYNMRDNILDDSEGLETRIYMFVVPKNMREQLQVGFSIPNTYFDIEIPKEISQIPDSVIARGECLWEDIAQEGKKVVYFDQYAYIPYDNSIYFGATVCFDEVAGTTSGYMAFMPVDFTQGIDLNYDKLSVGISEADIEDILSYSELYDYVDYNKMQNSIEVRCSADEDLQIGKHDIFSKTILIEGRYDTKDLQGINSEDIRGGNSKYEMTMESCMYDYGNRLDIYVENGENSFSIMNGNSDEVRVRKEKRERESN